MPELAVKRDQRAARALDRDRLPGGCGLYRVAGAQMGSRDASKRTAVGRVLGQAPVAVGVERDAAPGLGDTTLVAVQ
ncbi:MAG: hypothetical protein OXH09_12250, partial [Gammaproteobacteria bacterium]|nr:hypothetical protein [Gammaproteobacteria bacterium]